MRVWLGISLLILVAWAMKRLANRRKMDRWADEESPVVRTIPSPPDETVH